VRDNVIILKNKNMLRAIVTFAVASRIVEAVHRPTCQLVTRNDHVPVILDPEINGTNPGDVRSRMSTYLNYMFPYGPSISVGRVRIHECLFHGTSGGPVNIVVVEHFDGNPLFGVLSVRPESDGHMNYQDITMSSFIQQSIGEQWYQYNLWTSV